ncbi:vacuolar 14 C family protein, putative [Babesia ovis]|uniref:Vacuolar 14 C family protein, putative n=1 Tax=Babesia ovis TaxID=5869 RepID=A0A9W5WTK9_BABOV|nr:vacuolar 14 C family protein, putative [Babesia ovis]
MHMAAENKESENDINLLSKLLKLTKRLNHAISAQKDLTKEKYQKYYTKCKEQRELLERQAIEALDGCQETLFNEIADAVHSASVTLTEYEKQIAAIEKVFQKSASLRSRMSSKDGSTVWTAFPEETNLVHDRSSTTQGDGLWPAVNPQDYINRRNSRMSVLRESDLKPAMVLLPKNSNYTMTTPPEKGSVYDDGSPVRQDRGHVTNQREERTANGRHKDGDGRNSDKLDGTRTMFDVSSDVVDIALSTKDDRSVYNRDAVWKDEHDMTKQLTEDGRWLDHIPHAKDSWKHGHDIEGYDRVNDAASGLDRITPENNLIDEERRDKFVNGFPKQTVGTVTPSKHQKDLHDQLCIITTRDDLRRQEGTPTGNPKQVESDDRSSYVNAAEIDSVQTPDVDKQSPYAIYSQLLESCLMFTDGRKLAMKLKNMELREKIVLCNKILDDGPDLEMVNHLAKDVPQMKYAVPKLMQKPTSVSTDRVDAEPLWRVEDDGGVSSYFGRYLAVGDTLFVGIHFSVYLVMRTLPGSTIIEAHIDVKRNIQNLDMFVDLVGPDAGTMHVLNRSPVSITFRCKHEMWATIMPSLAVSLIESDGTKREIFIKLPIGPFSFLQPLEMPQKQIEHIMNNDASVGFYTMKKTFLSNCTLQLHNLLAVLSKYFAVTKTNTKQTLSAVGLNNEMLIAALRTNGNMITVEMWSPNEKTMSNAAICIKEIAAALNAPMDSKIAIRSLHTMRSFPLEFKSTY